MNGTGKGRWIAPTIVVVISVALWAFCLSLPDKYTDQHMWTDFVALAALILFIYGAVDLFWSVIPRSKFPLVFFYLGLVVMVLCLIMGVIAGLIVGAVATILGAAMLFLQRGRT